MKKKLRKRFTFALAMIMIVASMFTGIGTVGLTEVQAAEEPAGRGTDWDILYSEIRANGNGKAYEVGTRIYMDIYADESGEEDSFYIDTLETAADLHYVSVEGEIDQDYVDVYCMQNFDLNSIVTLNDHYSFNDKVIKSGGYWILIWIMVMEMNFMVQQHPQIKMSIKM